MKRQEGNSGDGRKYLIYDSKVSSEKEADLDDNFDDFENDILEANVKKNQNKTTTSEVSFNVNKTMVNNFKNKIF